MPGRIFISYRRDDVAGDARGIRDGLAARFGRASIFMDIDNLLPGQRFDEELAKALEACDGGAARRHPRPRPLSEARRGARALRPRPRRPGAGHRRGAPRAPPSGAWDAVALARRCRGGGRGAPGCAVPALLAARHGAYPERAQGRRGAARGQAGTRSGAEGRARGGTQARPRAPKAAPPPRAEPEPTRISPSRAVAPLTAAEEKAAQRGDTFRECDACPEMVVVPAGSFTMGSSPAEIAALTKEYGPDGPKSEGPQRRVTFARPFAVGKFEVTFAEWDACVDAGGCQYRPNSYWGRGRQPVVHVSWDHITKEYLPWLSRKTGKSYRLLTEAEWEYAARAGTTTRYAFGDSISTSQARHDASGTVAVGSFQPNAFGLYDMHGNVWEWVQDCWNGSYQGAPSDGSAWTTGDCSRRVLRGGSCDQNPAYLRSATYLRSAVRYVDFTYSRDDSIGFRVGRTF